MSYAIVFQTIVVEKENKIYWFNRSGRNNDDFGRKASDFTLTIYDNKELALKGVERFKNCFDDELKLSGKIVNYDYYYNYLKKKIEKPLSYEKFKSDYCNSYSQLKSIKCLNNDCEYNPQEYNSVYYDLRKKYNAIRIMYNYQDLKFEDLTGITDLTSVRIYIKKYRK